jgi:hypothetical protein
VVKRRWNRNNQITGESQPGPPSTGLVERSGHGACARVRVSPSRGRAVFPLSSDGAKPLVPERRPPGPVPPIDPVAGETLRRAQRSSVSKRSYKQDEQDAPAHGSIVAPPPESSCACWSRLAAAPGPEEGEASTSQGHSYGIFQKALKRGNLPAAEAAARELPQINLADALELTILFARKDPRRFQRIAARWLLRYLDEHAHATIEEAGLAASCLAALGGATSQEAAQTLRAMAVRATSRRRAQGVA